MPYWLKLALYSVAIVIVGFGILVLGLRRPMCEKTAKGWSIDATSLAVDVEEYRARHGNYPVAFSGKAVKAALGKPAQPRGLVEDGLLEYWSDGESYVVSLSAAGSGPISSSSLVFEIRNGEWYLWPQCLTSEARKQSRDRIFAARSAAVSGSL